MVNTDNFTKELKELISYTKSDVCVKFPTGLLTSVHLAYAMLQMDSCVAHKALDKTTMSSEIESLTNEYKSILDSYTKADQELVLESELKKVLEKLANEEKIDEISIKSLFKEIQKETNIKGKDLYMPIRLKITGKNHGLEMYHIIEILGRDLVLSRL